MQSPETRNLRPASYSGRSTERAPITLPARLTWRDPNGTMRFASVVTRNVSECGVYVESQSPLSIPLFRLVRLQIEGDARRSTDVPMPLRRGHALSAVYRITPPAGHGGRHGLALRLMVEPRRVSQQDLQDDALATA